MYVGIYATTRMALVIISYTTLLNYCTVSFKNAPASNDIHFHTQSGNYGNQK